ncbi:MAG: hypothetical protein DCC59_03270 [Chloroflexi bacterium]|mgnify:FL=1|nr:MAG: hypothetical protein DCC59_03270 [Chloroflexota bacterium]
MLGDIKLAGRVLSNLEQAVAVQEDRCIRLKHKRSSCQDCVTNCPTEAIKVGHVRGHILIDWEKCVACGICVNACKTSVFALKQYTDRDLLERGRGIIEKRKGLEIRCSKADQDPETPSVEVSCLGFINAAHIVAFAAYGAETIHFRHGNCHDCEAKWGDARLLEEMKTADDILGAFTTNKTISLTVGNYPAPFKLRRDELEGKKTGAAMSRREFFKYLTRQAGFSAAKTVTVFWDSETKPARQPIDFNHKFQPAKRQLLLTALRTSEPPDKKPFDPSKNLALANMEIESSQCGLCESCARFCPTGALTQRTVRDVRGRMIEAELKFYPFRCVKCGFCLEACFTRALKYGGSLDKNLFLQEGAILLKHRVKEQILPQE